MCEIEQFCDDLNFYLMGKFGYKSKPAKINKISNTISAGRKYFDFYFRYKPHCYGWEPDTLVIASIGFLETRKGHGTHLLKFIMSVSERYKISRIGIEQANSDEVIAFALKHGFEEFKRKQWIIEISELEFNLTNYTEVV